RAGPASGRTNCLQPARSVWKAGLVHEHRQRVSGHALSRHDRSRASQADSGPGDAGVTFPMSSYYAGMFLLSLATLLLELSLTRVLSVALWYHFGFLIISTALLGFGSAGVLLTLWTDLRDRAPLDRTLARLSIAFGATTIVSFWAMQRIPFDPFRPLL